MKAILVVVAAIFYLVLVILVGVSNRNRQGEVTVSCQAGEPVVHEGKEILDADNNPILCPTSGQYTIASKPADNFGPFVTEVILVLGSSLAVNFGLVTGIKSVTPPSRLAATIRLDLLVNLLKLSLKDARVAAAALYFIGLVIGLVFWALDVDGLFASSASNALQNVSWSFVGILLGALVTEASEN